MFKSTSALLIIAILANFIYVNDIQCVLRWHKFRTTALKYTIYQVSLCIPYLHHFKYLATKEQGMCPWPLNRVSRYGVKTLKMNMRKHEQNVKNSQEQWHVVSKLNTSIGDNLIREQVPLVPQHSWDVPSSMSLMSDRSVNLLHSTSPSPTFSQTNLSRHIRQNVNSIVSPHQCHTEGGFSTERTLIHVTMKPSLKQSWIIQLSGVEGLDPGHSSMLLTRQKPSFLCNYLSI